MNLKSVSIGIKTFLRDEALFTAIAGIRETMPEVKMIIADDGEHTEEKDGIYADLTRDGHKIIFLPFDSGFGMKSNHIAAALNTPYLLIGSDDFDFRPPSVRAGIEKMVAIFDFLGGVDILGGRVHGPYEFHLEDRGDTIIEHPVRIDNSPVQRSPIPVYVPCDLTVNYTLVRSRVLKTVRWDDDVKIGGGEHGAFFVDVKRAGFRVAYVPGVEISEQSNVSSPRYMRYRMRSGDGSRPCFDRRGIRKYILGTGQVDYESSVRS